MPRPSHSAGRPARPAPAVALAAQQRSARAVEPSSPKVASVRRRKGVPSRAPSRTEPSIVPPSVPVLVKVLLKEQSRPAASLDNLRSAPSSLHSHPPDGAASAGKGNGGKKKRSVARDALPTVLEGYGRGKRAHSAGVIAAEQQQPQDATPRNGRGRSPLHTAGRAASPSAVAGGSRRYTPYPAAAGGGSPPVGAAYTQQHDYTPHHHSPLSPPNQYRTHRSRSTGPTAGVASSSQQQQHRSPPLAAAAAAARGLTSPSSSTTITGASSSLALGNAYAMGIAAVTAPSPLARSFSATNLSNGTVADAVAAATASTSAPITGPPPPLPIQGASSAAPTRARTPSTTASNGGAYRVAELSGTPIQ